VSRWAPCDVSGHTVEGSRDDVVRINGCVFDAVRYRSVLDGRVGKLTTGYWMVVLLRPERVSIARYAANSMYERHRLHPWTAETGSIDRSRVLLIPSEPHVRRIRLASVSKLVRLFLSSVVHARRLSFVSLAYRLFCNDYEDLDEWAKVNGRARTQDRECLRKAERRYAASQSTARFTRGRPERLRYFRRCCPVFRLPTLRR
jgi:hypothetical protein